MACRAKLSMARRSLSERNGISGFLGAFQHAELAALLDAVVHVSPEALEILRGGHESADDYQPEQEQRQRFQRRVARANNQHRDSADLQDHFGLAEDGSFNGE